MSNQGSGGDKQIKLSVAVDGRSFDQAKSALRDLTALAQNFVKTLNGASIGNLFGGASGRTLGTGGGGINAPGKLSAGGGSGGGGGGNPLVAAIQANKSLLQSASTDSKAAFKVMTDGLRGAIRDQSGEIDKLQAKLRQLNDTYSKLNSSSKAAIAAGVPNPEAQAMRQRMMGNMQGEIMDNTSALGGAQKSLADLHAMDTNPYGGIFGRGSRARRRYGAAMSDASAGEFEEYAQYEGSMKPSGGGFGGMMRGLGYTGTGMGGGMGGLMRQAAPGLAIAGGYEMLHSMQMGRDAAVAQQTLFEGQRRQFTQAGTNQVYGNLGMQMKGDVNMALAMGGLTGSDIAGAIGKEQMKALLTQAHQQAKATGGLGAAKEDTQDWVARMLDASEENMSAQDQTVRSMALEQGLSQLPVKAAERLHATVQAKYQAQNMQTQADLSTLVGSHYERMGQQRAYGSSKMVQTDVDENGNPVYASAAAMSGIGTKFQSEEVNAMRGQLRGAVGNRHVGAALSMLGYQAGGLGNAVGLYGGAVGYGNAGSFMSALARGAGTKAGYNDVPVAGQVGAMYQAGMQGGDMFTSGIAGMQGVMSVSGAMGGDLRAGREVGQGFQALSNYQSGGIDRLQQGINVLASVQAAGSGKLYEQEAYRNMSTAQRMDLMRQIASGDIKSDKDLPEELRLQGVTVEGFKKYGQAQDKFMFSRFQSAQATPEVAAQVASFRQSGFDSLSGLKGKALTSAFKRLGVAGMQGGLDSTVRGAQNMMMLRMAESNPAVFAALKAGGIGDPSGGIEAKIKDNLDNEKLRLNRSLGNEGTQVAADVGTGKAAQKGAQSMIAMGQNFNASTTAVSKALVDLANDINEARHSIRTGKPMQPKTGAPANK